MPRLWLPYIILLVLSFAGSASSWAQPTSSGGEPSTALRLEGPNVVRVGEAATFRLTTPAALPSDARFAWTLGDGVEASGTRVLHRYTATGTYELTVRAVGAADVRPVETSIRVLPASQTSSPDAFLVKPPTRIADALAAEGRAEDPPKHKAEASAERRFADGAPDVHIVATASGRGDAAETRSWTGETWGGIAALVAIALVGLAAWLRRRRQLRLQRMASFRAHPDPTRPLRPEDAANEATTPVMPTPPPPVQMDVTARRVRGAHVFSNDGASEGASATSQPSADSRTSGRGS